MSYSIYYLPLTRVCLAPEGRRLGGERGENTYSFLQTDVGALHMGHDYQGRRDEE